MRSTKLHHVVVRRKECATTVFTLDPRRLKEQMLDVTVKLHYHRARNDAVEYFERSIIS